MTNIIDLQKYLDYEFSSGTTTGSDYKKFENKYINYLKSICKQNSWELVKVNKNHYEFSAFIKNKDNHYIYMSISDVRYWNNDWHNHILIRDAKNEQDYRGGRNQYIKLPHLEESINYTFERIR